MIIGFTGYAGSGKDTTAAILRDELAYRGHVCQVTAFAAPLKQFVANVFDFTWADLNDGVEKERHRRFTVNKDLMFERFETAFCDIMLTYVCSGGVNDIGDSFADATQGRSVNEMFDVLLTALETECKIRRSLLGGRYIDFETTPRRVIQRVGTEFFRAIDNEFWVKIAPNEDVIFADVRFPQEHAFIKGEGGTIVRVINTHQSTLTTSSNHESETNCERLKPDHIVINDGTSMENLIVAVKKLAADICQDKRVIHA